MTLTNIQVGQYNDHGYLVVENVFSQQEVEKMLEEMRNVIGEESPRRILEKNGLTRSFFGPDLTNDLFKRITRLKRLVDPSVQLIGDRVYVHQTKLNTKHAMFGDCWEWHQDYVFWKKDDGMPEAKVLTAMIFLNAVTEFNGPMLLIPGSHKAGVVDVNDSTGNGEDENSLFHKYQQSTSYMSALTVNLKYRLHPGIIAQWAEKQGIVSVKVPAGSVLFFHGNVFHASSNNLSPWNRYAYMITYNSINNTLAPVSNPRPEFIASRDFTSIVAVDEERL
jgi:ectoine hydroxylase